VATSYSREQHIYYRLKSGREDAWGGHLQLCIYGSWAHVEKEKTVKMEETNEGHAWRKKNKEKPHRTFGTDI
jgi:hypothetical protein